MSETYAIEDCWKYFDGEVTTTITSINLPSKYTMDYEIIKKQNGSYSAQRITWGNNNTFQSGFDDSSNTNLMIWDGSNVRVISGLAMNTWGKVSLNVDNSTRTVTMTALNSTVSLSNISTDLTILNQIGYLEGKASFRNVKIKPL